MQPLPDSKTRPRKREEHLSKNGKWRSFPKVPHLLQYVISGNYFGKVKINGRKIHQSLQTSVWSTAQLRLNDFLKEHRENRNKVEPPKFSEVVELFKQELENDTTIKPRSKEYRLLCLQKIQTSWPELWRMRLDEIFPGDPGGSSRPSRRSRSQGKATGLLPGAVPSKSGPHSLDHETQKLS